MDGDGARARRYRELWADELAGAALYRALAGAADEPQRGILIGLAEAEERHASYWAQLLSDAGFPPGPAPRLPLRVRVLSFLARRLGVDAVLPMVLRLEASDAAKYDEVAEAPDSMATQERLHGRVVQSLTGGTPGAGIARSEGRHRIGAGGALRASVFGFNDGLVSNLSLVMGVAGGSGNARLVLLAGVAGLLAGSFSMAAGEWVSVRSQRELYERELDIEREELEHFPEEEREELALIFRAKGIERSQAETLAEQVMNSPETALDTLAREELGLDPGVLVSPWIAASSSFVSFALGAVIPVVPYMIGSGTAAFAWAAGLSGVLLAVAGAGISVFTSRSALRSGSRMVVIGALAAGATYLVGSLIGVSVT